LTRDTVKYYVEDFISELSQISYSDLLIQVNRENKSVILIHDKFVEQFFLPISSKLNQILKIASNYKKTSDIQSLCLSYNLLKWNFKGKTLESPIFLFPLKYKINKVKNQCEFKLETSEIFLNPFLVKSFKSEFEIKLNDFEMENNLDHLLEKFKEILSNNEFQFELVDHNFIGNFHHHRYEVLKDLEELLASKSENNLVKILLGDESNTDSDYIELCSKNCFETDTDQKEIFRLLEKNNLLVQGPPGTGKSQVLANLLSKLLLNNQKQLVVSEKTAALTVLVKKLETQNLNHFAFVFNSHIKNGDFIKHLKKTWIFLENLEIKKQVNLNLSEQYLQQIQQNLDKLNQVELMGDLSLSELQTLTKSEKFKKIQYVSNLPDYKSWLEFKEIVKDLFNVLEKPAILSYVKHATFNSIENFDSILNTLIQDFTKLNHCFEIEKLGELDTVLKQAIRIQLIENEQNKKYFELINSKSKQKKFFRLKNEFQIIKNKLNESKLEMENWIKIPSLTEIQTYLKIIENSNFIERIKIRNLVKKRLKNKNIDFHIALKNALKHQEIFAQSIDNHNSFISLGIENPEIEINLITYFIQQITASDDNELNVVYTFDETKKRTYIEHHNLIEKFRQNIKIYFIIEEDLVLNTIFHQILKNLPQLIQLKNKICKLPQALIGNFKNVDSFEAFELSILKSNWVKFTSIYPDFSSFNGEKLNSLLDKTIQLEESENFLFSEEIIIKKLTDFNYFHTLLNTTSSRLSQENKDLKQKLKNGKSILVKEFSKSKQHRSLRELLSSDAAIWLDLLCPLHLSTPLMVSRNYPLESDLFQFVIFDEASQLVLPKAISCVQRAKRMLIAGDSQQMSPSSFFLGKISSVDLLHQASYYLPKTSLKHHYRSVHGELIKFSNKFFYNNELIVYPSAEKNEQVINFHFVENAIYENRENLIEAKEVANFLIKHIDSYKSIGLVTFSEQQLNCIYRQFDPKSLEKIQKKIENKQLFFSTLEQVQGEECDHLIISLAYGKDTNGKFHLRFGPLNQTSGTKRLNVLFSRAKEKIDFFSSVKSSDFELSKNESINLLRIYIQEAEIQGNNIQDFAFPFGIIPEIKGKNLKIKSIYEKITSAEELKTFHKVMTDRKWKISYQL
jgi:superfamily I DNA and/or RNA helicase